MIKQAKDRPYLNDRLPAKADIVLMIPKRVTFNASVSLRNCFNCKQIAGNKWTDYKWTDYCDR